MSKYTTDELVNIITCAFKDRVFLRKDCLAIIARLRAGDKLCAQDKKMMVKVAEGAGIKLAEMTEWAKAIAEYEEVK